MDERRGPVGASFGSGASAGVFFAPRQFYRLCGPGASAGHGPGHRQEPRCLIRMTDGFAFFPLTFDERGKLESTDEFDALVAQAKTPPPATDVIFLAHGFRNDADDATGLYNTFLRTLRANLGRPEFSVLAPRRFVVAGVYWPS